MPVGAEAPGYRPQPAPTPAAPPGAPQAAWPAAMPGLADPRRKSPALACILSAMPGLGQIYVGYYSRGFIHAIVVGSIIAILSWTEDPNAGHPQSFTPLLGIFLAFFWLYNIIDAGRRAALYNYSLAGMTNVELPDDFTKTGIGGSLLGGAVLVVAGVVALSNTLLGLSLDWLRYWWPVAPLAFGIYLIAKAVMERGKAK
jgi:TM2 domain-containing membrane protein YozV